MSGSAHTCFVINGFRSCGYFVYAREAATAFVYDRPNFNITLRGFDTRADYIEAGLAELHADTDLKAGINHKTSPYIYSGCAGKPKSYVGGASDFVLMLKKQYNYDYEKERKKLFRDSSREEV